MINITKEHWEAPDEGKKLLSENNRFNTLSES